MFPKRPRGRPRFKPTPEQRREVETLSVALSQEAIARRLGFSVETLVTYFAAELQHGRDVLLAETMIALRAAVAKGSLPAIRLLRSIAQADLPTTQDPDLVDAAGKAAAPEAHPEPKPPKLGKKELAQIEALSAGEGSEWGEDLKVGGALPN